MNKIFIGKCLTILSFEDDKVHSQVKFFTNKKQIISEAVEIETFLNSIISEDQGKEITFEECLQSLQPTVKNVNNK